MKAVLYTDTMEPITIIDLPIEVHKFQYRLYRVPVIEDLMVTAYNENIPIKPQPLRTVDVRVEPLCRNGEIYPMFFVSEHQIYEAFELTPEFLPGQKDEIYKRERLIEKLSSALIHQLLSELD